MPKYLADGKRAIRLLSTRPADIDAITATEGNAGEDLSTFVLTTSVLGPTGSDTFNEKVWASRGNSEDFGPSNFAGNNLVIHRYYDETSKQPDPTDDAAWDALKTKGTTVRLLVRVSAKDSAETFAAGDEYRYMEYVTDDPQDQSGDGYQKFLIPLGYQGVSSLDQLIVAGI